MESGMRGCRDPRSPARALALALLGLGLAGGVAGGLAAAAGAAERGDAAASATAADAAGAPAEGAAAAPSEEPARPHRSSELDRHRGESVDLDARSATTSAPDFGAEARDPGALPGRAKPLDAVARPPDGRDPGPREDAEPREGSEDAPPPGLAPLRLRRRPDVAAPAERSLAERLCVAERDLAFARREHRDAVRAYKRARREEYPRGANRALVVEHRALAGRRLERAEAERDALLAEAETQNLDPTTTPCRRSL